MTTHLFHFRFANTEQYWQPSWLFTVGPGAEIGLAHVLLDFVFLLEPSASELTTGIMMDSGDDV